MSSGGPSRRRTSPSLIPLRSLPAASANSRRLEAIRLVWVGLMLAAGGGAAATFSSSTPIVGGTTVVAANKQSAGDQGQSRHTARLGLRARISLLLKRDSLRPLSYPVPHGAAITSGHPALPIARMRLRACRTGLLRITFRPPLAPQLNCCRGKHSQQPLKTVQRCGGAAGRDAGGDEGIRGSLGERILTSCRHIP